MPDLTLIFNARFATRPQSGVDRVAGEIGRSLCELSYELGKSVLHFSIALPSKPEKIVNNDLITLIGDLLKDPSRTAIWSGLGAT